MISEYLSLAYKNIQKRKARSLLTLIGILIAVATIFVLVSVSLGLQGAVEEQFEILGVDKMFIQPRGQLAGPGTGGAVQLTEADVNVVEKVQGVRETSIWILSPGKVEFKDQTRFVNIAGYPLDDLFIETGNYKIDEGKFLQKGDTGKVMIGSQYKHNNFFDKPLSSGDRILINDREFEVETIIETVGNPQDDRLIYMSEDDFRDLFDIRDRIDFITVQIQPNTDINEVADNIQRKLDNSRDVDDKNRDFSILTPEELLESFGQILTIITGFLLAVAGISLLVGGIGIANTMYTSVLERTKEIGTMKALGSRNSHILKIFLTESGLLGLVGGLLGVLLGFAIAKTIEFIAINQLSTNLLQVATPFYLFAACLAFAFLAGSISGIWPAYKAANTNTVDALRYE